MADTARPILVGVFNDRYQAELAVDELHQAGFTREQVGFALRGVDVDRGGTLTDAIGAHDAQGAVSGAVTGGVVGGLLGAAAALMLPGIGPVLAYGVLTTALGFSGAGAAVGGILGAMAGAGLTEEEAEFYQQQFDAGRAIVTVHPKEAEALASEIIHRHGGYDMIGYETQAGIVTPGPVISPNPSPDAQVAPASAPAATSAAPSDAVTMPVSARPASEEVLSHASPVALDVPPALITPAAPQSHPTQGNPL